MEWTEGEVSLPPEIWILIVSKYLSSHAIVRLRQVSKANRELQAWFQEVHIMNWCDFKLLQKMPRIKKISADVLAPSQYAYLDQLPTLFPRLAELDLSLLSIMHPRTNPTDFIAKLPNLERLTINTFPKNMESIIHACTRLTSLKVPSTGWPYYKAGCIEQMTQLVKLQLSESTALSGSNLTNLTSLALCAWSAPVPREKNVGITGIEKLGKLSELRALKFGQLSYAELKELPNLERLSFNSSEARLILEELIYRPKLTQLGFIEQEANHLALLSQLTQLQSIKIASSYMDATPNLQLLSELKVCVLLETKNFMPKLTQSMTHLKSLALYGVASHSGHYSNPDGCRICFENGLAFESLTKLQLLESLIVKDFGSIDNERLVKVAKQLPNLTRLGVFFLHSELNPSLLKQLSWSPIKTVTANRVIIWRE